MENEGFSQRGTSLARSLSDGLDPVEERVMRCARAAAGAPPGEAGGVNFVDVRRYCSDGSKR